MSKCKCDSEWLGHEAGCTDGIEPGTDMCWLNPALFTNYLPALLDYAVREEEEVFHSSRYFLCPHCGCTWSITYNLDGEGCPGFMFRCISCDSQWTLNDAIGGALCMAKENLR